MSSNEDEGNSCFTAKDMFQILLPNKHLHSRSKLFWRFSTVMTMLNGAAGMTKPTAYQKFSGGHWFRAAVHKSAEGDLGVFVNRRGGGVCKTLFEICVFDKHGREIIREEYDGNWDKDCVDYLGGSKLLSKLPTKTSEVLIVVDFKALGPRILNKKRALEAKDVKAAKVEEPPLKKPKLEERSSSFKLVVPRTSSSQNLNAIGDDTKPVDTALALTVCEWLHDFDPHKVQKIFDEFDEDKNGYLDEQEFVKSMGIELDNCISKENLLKVFNHIDVDNSGMIDFDEFMKWIIPTADYGSTLKKAGKVPAVSG